jgi:hypothetical protein
MLRSRVCGLALLLVATIAVCVTAEVTDEAAQENAGNLEPRSFRVHAYGKNVTITLSTKLQLAVPLSSLQLVASTHFRDLRLRSVFSAQGTPITTNEELLKHVRACNVCE